MHMQGVLVCRAPYSPKLCLIVYAAIYTCASEVCSVCTLHSAIKADAPLECEQNIQFWEDMLYGGVNFVMLSFGSRTV